MMKGGGGIFVVGCSINPGSGVSALTPSPFSQQQSYPTPSPFAISVASTRRSVHFWSLMLRLLALVFSFTSALSLAASSSRNRVRKHSSTFANYPELLYCLIVPILVFLYSALQLLKGVCDIAHRGRFVSELVSDYLSFVVDQVACYLLVSTSSMTVPIIGSIVRNPTLQKATIISAAASFTAFMAVAASALLSGYKLCKRVIW